MYPGILTKFGWPVYFARMAGMATLLWTSLLFLSMSRTWFRIIVRYSPLRSYLYVVMDAHKELHIFCGKMLLLTSCVHVFAHCVGTVPALARSSPEDVNSLVGCVNPDTTKGY